ncbi:MAG: VWA domain-containing protein, partial [Selenomonadaceae bacterium]|nr:VWA domain-containing protein [Selenomonadaceae bacterium]
DLAGVAADPFASGNQYAGGFVASRFLAKHIGSDPQDTMKKFMRGLVAGGTADGAFSYVSGGAFNEQGFKDMYSAAYAKYNGDNIAFLKNECGIELNNADTGAVTGYDAGNGVVKNKYNVVSQASRPMNWSLPSSSMTMINGLEISWPKGYNASPTAGTMVFHTGTGANQAMKVSFFDMSARSIGLIDEEGKKLNVSTIGNANQAIGQLDKIINVVLDEATNIGAIQQRLGFTEANVTSSTENTQGAESTIRDADMAKEMTEYGKSNVLSQAAQSMLSKANQAMSSVLSMVTQNGNDTVEESQDTSEAERNSDENLSEVGKDLQKVASGQKINSAADDASAYGISEQMRVQIRGLDQDVQNVKNGTNMLQTALGGINNIVDELRSLKELAINAANDSNTDLDRMTIQKEFDQRRATIDEIATWTNYNGKPLIDGNYHKSSQAIDASILDVVFVVDTTGSMSPPITSVADNLKTFADRLTELGKKWRFGLVTYDDITDISGKRIGINKASFKTGQFTSDADEFEEALRSIRVAGGGDEPESGYEAILDNVNGALSFKYSPNAVKSIIVLTDASAHDSEDSRVPGMYSATDVVNGMKKRGISNFYSIIKPESTESTYPDPAHTDWTRITDAMNGKWYDINSDYGESMEEIADDPSYTIRDVPGNPLWIQHGTHANQRINVYLNSMTTSALGIDMAEVTTRSKANSAIAIIDEAITYALDEATNVGAYLQRLEYTESNIVAENENTQAAESTIRDADMAKEYTKYTKDSVLAQASQSMLAQANQNPKFVMSVI